MDKAKQEELIRRIKLALWEEGIEPGDLLELIESIVEERCKGLINDGSLSFEDVAVDAIADAFCSKEKP